MNTFLYRYRWLITVTALISYVVAGRFLVDAEDRWFATFGVTVGAGVAVFMSVVQMRHQAKTLSRLLPAVQPPPRDDAVLTLEIYQATPEALGLTAFGYGVIAPADQLAAILRQAADVVAKNGQEGMTAFKVQAVDNPGDKPVDNP